MSAFLTVNWPFWMIKVFIGCENNNVGCIYDSTIILNAGEKLFLPNIHPKINLVAKMAAS